LQLLRNGEQFLPPGAVSWSASIPTGISSVADVAGGLPGNFGEIVALTSGRERRNVRLAHSRRRYDAGTGVRSLADIHTVLAFFEARRGSLHARGPPSILFCYEYRATLGRLALP
jgi:hypothetical protein